MPSEGIPPRMLVISGPSGVGKTTLIRRMRRDPRVWWSVSATTRPARPGEVDGEDYYFLDDAEFVRRVDAGGFLEHAEVHGKRYGTLRQPVEEALAAGKLPLLDLDVQGALAVMQCDLPATFVFVEPPSFDVLETRLRERNSDDDRAVTRRLQRARDELTYAARYDHRVVNDDLDGALAQLLDIVRNDLGLALELGE